MKTKLILSAIGVSAVLTSGCITPMQSSQQRNRDMVRLQENYRIMGEENRQMKGQLEGLQLELQAVQDEFYTGRTQLSDAQRSGTRDLEARIADLERQLQLLDRQREQDKKDIIESLSQKIAKLMQGSGGARSAPAGQKKRARSEYGYEHVVRPGETLSEIATAYGVSVGVLIRENELKNPNVLQAGQKLFVPE